jgi:mannosyltransferase OCH1-like enzyme
LHDWTEEEIFDTEWENQVVINDLYRQSKHERADMVAYYTHVADVVDYELVYRHGGWYFNTDLKPLQPLSALGEWNTNNAAFAYEDSIHLVNMAMYAPAGDPFFEHLITRLSHRYFARPGAYMNESTGVQLIMDSLKSFKAPPGYGDITRFGRKVFNPIHWSEFDYGKAAPIDREYGPETIAVHEWLHRTNMRGQKVL